VTDLLSPSLRVKSILKDIQMRGQVNPNDPNNDKSKQPNPKDFLRINDSTLNAVGGVTAPSLPPRVSGFLDKDSLPKFAQVLFDFDGTLFPTEKLRQIGWLMVAYRPKYVDYFGGKDALDHHVERCRIAGRGVFQGAIGASQKEHQEKIADVAKECRQFLPEGSFTTELNIDVFRKERDDLVKKLMKRHTFSSARGMFELFTVLDRAKVPVAVVTQSTRKFVREALGKGLNSGDKATQRQWSRLLGRRSGNILLLCREDFEARKLNLKPSPEPYRFARCLLSLMAIRGDNARSGAFSRLKPYAKELKFAARLAKFEPNSEEFLTAAEKLLGPNAPKFKMALPSTERTLVVEDSDTGLIAGREFSTFLVDNGVGASKEGRAIKKEPQLMTEGQKQAHWEAVAALAQAKAKVEYAGMNLLAVSDLVRTTNQVSRPKRSEQKSVQHGRRRTGTNEA